MKEGVLQVSVSLRICKITMEIIAGLGKMWVSGDLGKNHCNGVNAKLKIETAIFDN